MTTFETDVIVETADLAWFWPVFWIIIALAVLSVVLACVLEDVWASALIPLALAVFVVCAINVHHREDQTIRMGEILSFELQEAGFGDAKVGYMGNTKTGDGTDFEYAEGSQILECELVAGPEHGVFKVVCF